jgi:7,8-dihydropterin-6-yl-methyl-4-(beta-D-ribofuranosyl)aminobenzene 5'-phosphate synthase
MKLTVLCDNHTLIDRYFLGEPGLSFLIEDQGKRVLFDAGYSDVFLKNAAKAEENLLNLDYITLSHGHLDHTWGLVPLILAHQEAAVEKKPCRVPALVAHPQALEEKQDEDGSPIGSLLTAEILSRHFPLNLTKGPLSLTENLIFLGEIPRANCFENQKPVGFQIKDNKKEPDLLPDDTALVYKGSEGLVIITGCAHAGICNILDYTREVCKEEKIHAIIGGFHLLTPSPSLLRETLGFLKEAGVRTLYPCHCTDLTSIFALSQVAPVSQMGAGLVLQF